MMISYAICTHNEGEYLSDLLIRIEKFVRFYPDLANCEIVIVDDNSSDGLTQMTLRKAEKFDKIPCRVVYKKHEGNFADQKNFLTDLCNGDWIMNLDADEWIPTAVMMSLPQIIEMNSEADAFWFPRLNTVDGLTQKDVDRWGWNISVFDEFIKTRVHRPLAGYEQNIAAYLSHDEYEFLRSRGYIISEEMMPQSSFGDIKVSYKVPLVHWPDYQMRLYKKSPDIRWTGAVHEKLTGFKKYATLPAVQDFAIRHFKTIDRQREQNDLYDRIARKNT